MAAEGEEYADDGLGEGEEVIEPVVEEGDNTDPAGDLYKFHPEVILDYAETVGPLIPLQQAPPTQQSEQEGGDPNHRSPPFLTLYERTKILGARANQIAQGWPPYVVVPEHVTEPLEIAKLELEQRRLPYIIKRPMPDGTFEYWRLADLMIF
jgi:DNA-directed RNA polymerase I, II, and III subunit RPABC2